MKKKQYRIFLFSEMRGQYAPTLHPAFDFAIQAQDYARKTLKLEQNLTGKGAFQVR